MPSEVSTVSFRSVDQLVDRLDRSARCNEPVELDFGSIRSVSRSAVPLLSNALLRGAVGRAPLRLRGLSNTDFLVRSGVAFALANREGEVIGVDSQALHLPDWRRSWSPGSRAVRRSLHGAVGEKQIELFAPHEVGESADEPSLFGRYYASFINPHLAGAAGEKPRVTQVVRPWLHRVLPRYLYDEHDARGDDSLIAAVGTLVDELVDNVREHTASERRARSLMQVAITRGKPDRLYLTVQDTGPGLLNTVREKLTGSSLDLPRGVLLERLLKGDLPRWGRARGFGLPRVAAVMHARAGTMYIASDAVRLEARCGAAPEVRDDAPEVPGTAITLMLPLG